MPRKIKRVAFDAISGLYVGYIDGKQVYQHADRNTVIAALIAL